MHYHFQHIFYPDLLRRWPDHAALRHHVEAHGFASTESAPAPAEQPDPRLERLLSTLFEPVCRDYQRVAQALGPRDGLLLAPTVQSLVRDSAQAHLPDLHAAFSALVERKIIAVDPDRQGGYSWGQAADQLEAFAAACAGPASPRRLPDGAPTLITGASGFWSRHAHSDRARSPTVRRVALARNANALIAEPWFASCSRSTCSRAT